MRAVSVIVDRVVVVVVEVPAVNVVDEAVAVVVDAVLRDLVGVGEDVGGEVLVKDVHTGVDDGDHDLARPGDVVPGLRRTDVRARGAAVESETPGVKEVNEIRDATAWIVSTTDPAVVRVRA